MGLTSKAFSDIITFSRSSNATRVGPDGKIAYAPHNMLTYSEQFDNAAWTQYQATVTANSIASPDGTVTADTLIENTANDAHALTRGIALGVGIFTMSLYIKAASGGRGISILPVNNGGMGCNGSVVFSSTGQFVSTSGTGIVSYSSTSVGSDWYRLSVVFAVTTSGTTTTALILHNGSTITYTGNGSSGLYLWGAQLSQGSIAGDYTATTSAAVYGPRFDYDPVTLAAKGLLIEEQRTNLLTYSEEFDNAAWTKYQATIAANSIAAADGTVTADTLIENTANDAHALTRNISLGVGTFTLSLYYKAAAGVRNIGVLPANNGSMGCNGVVSFNGSGGFVSTSGTGIVSYSSASVGNGWYRLFVVFSVTTSGTAAPVIRLENGASISYTGDGASGIYIWGAQLEAGAFATSYIPTIASTVTRSADTASVSALSPWFNNAQGTWFAEMDVLSVAASTYHAALEAWASGDNNARMFVDIDAGTPKGYIRQNTAGSGTFMSTGVSASANSAVKIAMAFQTNNNATSASGSAVATSTTTTPTIDTVYLGRFGTAGASAPMCGHLRRIAFYPRRLTNAELQALTA